MSRHLETMVREAGEIVHHAPGGDAM